MVSPRVVAVAVPAGLVLAAGGVLAWWTFGPSAAERDAARWAEVERVREGRRARLRAEQRDTQAVDRRVAAFEAANPDLAPDASPPRAAAKKGIVAKRRRRRRRITMYMADW